MSNILRKCFDRFIGINFTIGFAVVLWIILGCFFDVQEIDRKNIIFMMISCVIPWLFNFIFSYTSKLYMKGLLHGVLWFVSEMIIFNLMYGIALDAFVFLRVAVVYTALYAIVLAFFYKLTSKLNIPVRHTSEFLGKLITTFRK